MEQQYRQLSGRTVLIIGLCSYSLRNVLEAFKRLNVKIVHVDTVCESYGDEYIDLTIKYHTFSRNINMDDETHVSNILALLGDKVKQISGCFTFFDEYLPLTALLCQKLGFTGISKDTAKIVNSKQKTVDVVKSDFDTAKYSPLSFRINTVQDIMNATELTFPAVLKPESGCWSSGVIEVLSYDDCKVKYQQVKEISATDWALFGTRDSSSMVLMEYLPGNSYQVEVIIYNGELFKGIPSTMGPKFMYLGSFLDTATCYTSSLPNDLESELITAGFKICRQIGLENGVFNVEFKLTASGFKLLEVNGRPGTYCRCAVFKETNGIDLYIMHALISCGIKPFFPEISKKFAVGIYLYSFLHGQLLAQKSILDKMEDLLGRNDILYIKQRESMSYMYTNGPFPKPFAHLIALGESVNMAKNKLIKICKELDLSKHNFDIEQLTERFY